MEKTNDNQFASLKISREVIATIAKVAACEIGGVASLSENKKNFRGLFLSRATKPIEINLSDDSAEIDLCLELEYGACIPDVCTAVQTAVKENVQTMTGIMVSKVNINVLGVTFPKQSEQD